MNSFRIDRAVMVAAALSGAIAMLSGCGTADPMDAGELAEAEDIGEASQAIDGAMPFGTMCQADFQNGWQTTLASTWTRCGGFNSRFDDVATHNYYYNLVGAKPTWENTLDAWFSDSVSFFYGSTHGGAWADTAVYTMWDQWSYAYTTSMRFDVLNVLSTYACKTLQMDGALVTRWYPAMAGGLSVVTGSHGYVYDWYYTDDTGYDYADNLAYQWNAKDAWIDGLWDAYTTQDVAALAAGSDANDCYSRLDYYSAYNYIYFPRRHDWEIGAMCYQYVTE